ncbi:acyl transferase domain protein [Burkholderia pseudomallei]|nr:acyl transferase domain protein [Burkholderia pseudomallei]
MRAADGGRAARIRLRIRIARRGRTGCRVESGLPRRHPRSLVADTRRRSRNADPGNRAVRPPRRGVHEGLQRLLRSRRSDARLSARRAPEAGAPRRRRPAGRAARPRKRARSLARAAAHDGAMRRHRRLARPRETAARSAFGKTRSMTPGYGWMSTECRRDRAARDVRARAPDRPRPDNRSIGKCIANRSRRAARADTRRHTSTHVDVALDCRTQPDGSRSDARRMPASE